MIEIIIDIGYYKLLIIPRGKKLKTFGKSSKVKRKIIEQTQLCCWKNNYHESKS